MQYGISQEFNRHFRVEQSMRALVFSTLNHHDLEYEPRVTVVIRPLETIRLIYTLGFPSPKGDEELEYELNFTKAMPTFQRFLNHLWVMTRTEPLPSKMRAPEHSFKAPALNENDRRSSHWPDRYELFSSTEQTTNST